MEQYTKEELIPHVADEAQAVMDEVDQEVLGMIELNSQQKVDAVISVILLLAYQAVLKERLTSDTRALQRRLRDQLCSRRTGSIVQAVQGLQFFLISSR